MRTHDGNCRCTPSRYRETNKRFWQFWFNAGTLYDKDYDTARCWNCGEILLVPKSYHKLYFWHFDLLMNIACWGGVGAQMIFNQYVQIERGARYDLMLSFGVALCLYYVLRRTLIASIFTFGKWRVISVDFNEEEYFWAEAREKSVQFKKNRGFPGMIFGWYNLVRVIAEWLEWI